MKLSDISVIVVTENDGSRLNRCLESVTGFGEILVVDSFSSDETVAVARSHRALVFFRAQRDVVDQNNWALKRVRHQWVLSLEPDDVVSHELRRAIEAVEEPSRCAGYAVSFLNHYLGDRIRGGGLDGEPAVRLFDRDRGRFETSVDEIGRGTTIVLDGETEVVGGDLLRYRYQTIEDHVDAIQTSSTRRARRAVEHGSRYTARWLPVLALVAPPVAFFWDYFIRRGVLGGRRGFLFCLIRSYGVFLDHAKTWEALVTSKRG
ncbi:MAG: glycosyltransferase family 2 protein [Candidatus Latescibacterota bacterium]|nr:MAG: glycosyltransferase family 2 protein [Candidatus Latescibacterota bacterium]